MSVKFNLVERGKLGSPDTPKKYYPQVITRLGMSHNPLGGKYDVLSCSACIFGKKDDSHL
jgi:hypothetical protein